METIYIGDGFSIEKKGEKYFISYPVGISNKIVEFEISKENVEKAKKSSRDAYEVMIYAQTGKWPLAEQEQLEYNKEFIRKNPKLLLTVPENRKFFSPEELEVLLEKARKEDRNTEHSYAYKEFKRQIKSHKWEIKKDGYYPGLLKNIYDSERKEIEKIIWKNFVWKNDIELAIFLPQLKYYDGIKALEKKLLKSKIPSRQSAEISIVLFEATNKQKYLDIIMQNYKEMADNSFVVVELAYLAKNTAVYNLLKDIYINDNDNTNRIQAINGILMHDGLIEDIKEILEKIDLIRAFPDTDKTTRENFIKEYQECSDKKSKEEFLRKNI